MQPTCHRWRLFFFQFYSFTLFTSFIIFSHKIYKYVFITKIAWKLRRSCVQTHVHYYLNCHFKSSHRSINYYNQSLFAWCFNILFQIFSNITKLWCYQKISIIVCIKHHLNDQCQANWANQLGKNQLQQMGTSSRN